jgi:hypothetical protein
MGSAPSKKQSEERTHPYTMKTRVVYVKPKVFDTALAEFRATVSRRPFYVYLRDQVSRLDSLNYDQFRSLEPIGQVETAVDFERGSAENPLLKHTYTWPPPTGDLERLRDIWECTEFSANARIQEPKKGWSPGGTVEIGADTYTVLLSGSAFTLDVADDLAKGIPNETKLSIGDFAWEMLERRILRALNQSGKYAAWHRTLNPEEQRMFSSEENTAALMRSYIKRLVRAWADAPKPAKLLF